MKAITPFCNAMQYYPVDSAGSLDPSGPPGTRCMRGGGGGGGGGVIEEIGV